ncbi:MAG: hypothetical protein KKE62_13850 [Proteobacteria bacterium]|nr:hypothetical protein [Pseudomonadota bacterium]MBU1389903.1 hypothetical protein [Pseudomonadota bacterium]MBU1543912.1 hypothetical protein [Pseudomonadota bacterium]MBU2429647.1 hypothetical protein [Pseudomonadota bacterium]MBU2482190.1 hypothetical protein [Pseudomonadota bacterium]
MQNLNRTMILIKHSYIFLFLAIAVCGWAESEPVSSMINAGDTVYINYTCRTDTGEVLITTDPDIANAEHLVKSTAFWDQSSYDDVRITAGTDAFAKRQKSLKFFDLEIYDRFSQALVGKKKGQSFDLELKAQLPQGLDNTIRYHIDPKTREVPIIKKMSLYNYTRSMGKAPVVGDTWPHDKTPYARVLSFDEKNVTYELIAPDGYPVATRWGMAFSKKMGDRMVSTIDAKVGTLVRWNRVLGKIIEVNDTQIKVDYGHPFGGEHLKCRVEIAADRDEKTEGKKQ